ncbi:MAG: EamA family transporter [Anaerolineae bacterium]|nr:EamA family transporter [Anaerolineae bacterium]
MPSRLTAALQALFVTFLWSTSFIFIKIGLGDIPALVFAGLRYGLAFLCLLPFALRPARRAPLRALTRGDWARLVALGLMYYTVTQGAQFVGLSYLPSVTVSLLLSFSPAIVTLLGVLLLNERPARMQWAGLALCTAGAVVYFYPVDIPAGEVVGLVVVGAGVLANSGSAVLGRRVNREGALDPVTVTVVSMGVGAGALLAAGLLVQGMPPLDAAHWLIIALLAVVNTAFAFTLWNHTLRTLSAMESSIINNTMLAQIAILAWLFLGEALTLKGIIGMGLVGAGALIVQLWRTK